MQIQCLDKKSFELSDNSKMLGVILYDSLFSAKATAVFRGEYYNITPKGIFSTTISVTNEDEEIATLRMNWKGNIIITFQNGQEFILKATGFFQNKYVLEDEDQEKILLLNPDFDWKKFIYNFTITYDRKPDDILLVLLATYAANYYIAAVSGGG